jgi:predicted acetyltransferase
MKPTTMYEISPPRPDEDEAFDNALGRSLHFPGNMEAWIERLGRESFRAVRQNGRILAGVALADAGQWFGGRRVPCMLVNGVGVTPEARGSGVGLHMMRAVLEELHASGCPLAALYPATLTFYRRAGFERAGSRITYELPTEAIDVERAACEIVPFGPEQYDVVKRLYTERARMSAGHLDRPAWMWDFRLEPPNQQPHRFLITQDGEPTGYVVYTQGSRTEPLVVTDYCARTPEAARCILKLFAGYRSMVDYVKWHGGPLDQLLYSLRENLYAGMRLRHRVSTNFDWMLRVIDVAGALEARGYPPGGSATLHFDVRDEALPQNDGRWMLNVADSAGHVRKGGDGDLRIDARGLAALYSGFMAPVELQAIGLLDGPADALARATAVFAGPRPWVGDMF